VDLYPDQTETISRLRSAMTRNKSVLLVAATGSGKTIMATSMIQSAVSRGHTCGFFVPRRELVRQVSRSLTDFAVPHTYSVSQLSHNGQSPVCVHSIPTSVRRLDTLKPPSLAFVDESHYGKGALDDTIGWLKSAGSFIVGLSATPSRLDGKGLGCYYDSLVSGPSTAALIGMGRLSTYRLYAPDAPDLSGIGTTAGDFNKGQLADFMERDRGFIGNAVTHYARRAMGRLNLAFFVSRAAATIGAQQFNAAGIPAAVIDGTMNDDERSTIIKAFARRQLLVLCSVDLLTFGFDLSSASGMDVTVECMSDLRPTQSLALQMQKWGRVLRRKPEPAIIFDHVLNWVRHGYPDDEREWALAGMIKKQQQGERAIPIRRCMACAYTHRPAPQCPECGFMYPIQGREVEQIEGELREVKRMTPEERAAIKAEAEAEAARRKAEVRLCKTREDLQRVADKYGYKRGWVFKQCQIRRIK